MNDLKNIRLSQGFSMQYMANILNISKTFYWQIENGKRRLSYDMAVKISNIFSLKPDDLFYTYFKEKIDI